MNLLLSLPPSGALAQAPRGKGRLNMDSRQGFDILCWFIAICAWAGSLCICGAVCYRKGKNAKKLVIESLSFKQAMKWWSYHELMRHEDDKRSIRKDIAKLIDVEMPRGISYETWVDVEGNPKIKGK